ASNVIPDDAVAEGTVRCLDDEAWHTAPDLVKKLVDSVTSAYGAEAEVTYRRGVPPTINEATSVEIMREAVTRALGPEAVVTTPQSLGGEDFAWYLEHVPGALARLGTHAPHWDGPMLDLHRGTFDVDESAIGVGTRFMVTTALTALTDHGGATGMSVQMDTEALTWAESVPGGEGGRSLGFSRTSPGGRVADPGGRHPENMYQPLTAEQIRRAPKVLLHDHLDGGLRPTTIVELARENGYSGLPTHDPEELGRWFHDASYSGSLERYLETFAHTTAVMQTRDALVRVAAEAAEDLAADGVVYAESRYAPEQHLEGGLTLEEVVEAVQEGLELGEKRAAEAGNRIRTGQIVTAMRHAARSSEIAELAVRYRDAGVSGFDIAGAEAGNPPTRHLDAFEYLRRENFHFTIHAGEAFGLPSIWEALQWCGCDRLGHGVRIVDDITVGEDGTS